MSSIFLGRPNKKIEEEIKKRHPSRPVWGEGKYILTYFDKNKIHQYGPYELNYHNYTEEGYGEWYSDTVFIVPSTYVLSDGRGSGEREADFTYDMTKITQSVSFKSSEFTDGTLTWVKE